MSVYDKMTAKTKVELLNGKRGGYIKFCFFGEIKCFKFSQNTKEFSKKVKNFFRKKIIYALRRCRYYVNFRHTITPQAEWVPL